MIHADQSSSSYRMKASPVGNCGSLSEVSALLLYDKSQEIPKAETPEELKEVRVYHLKFCTYFVSKFWTSLIFFLMLF